MQNGANSVHKQLRKDLEDYIKSTYFGKSPLLLSVLKDRLDEEGLLYQKPYIESSPAYKTKSNCMEEAEIEDWLKTYFLRLAQEGLGVYLTPFLHQISALEAATKGENVFVSTGTGSGKTECFMWPLLAKLAKEAKNHPDSWSKRGVRAIIMYPMNALVSDQLSRLRRVLGDSENKFEEIFQETCGQEVRRPQFGMYTSRTPYPGERPTKEEDEKLRNTLAATYIPQDERAAAFISQLKKEGKVPAKKDMVGFLEQLKTHSHTPDQEDAELITRFEMQKVSPDILITNYSMLEYMLLRPRERKIWQDTKEWLQADPENTLLFVIDEAHMYRGSAGGEVALLIRRLFHKLGISRDRVQFILTSASMPADSEAVEKFANELSASDVETPFCYLTGERQSIEQACRYEIPEELFLQFDSSAYEELDQEEVKLKMLVNFWRQVEGFEGEFTSLGALFNWMYDHLAFYRPFNALLTCCRENALSLNELAERIFPKLMKEKEEQALKALSTLLFLAPLAKSTNGSILFPVRMHMLFKSISGVYACTNEHCSHAHTEDGLTLGELFLSDGNLICPHCGSVVYELMKDRRCGALFFKGYVLEKEDLTQSESVYLWRYPGQIIDQNMKEIHLFIPTESFDLRAFKNKEKKYKINPCYLDVNSGFLHFRDDSLEGQPSMRKLYYCNYSTKGRPDVITFSTCPHCQHRLSERQISPFNVKGNESFFNLIKSQFQLQPAVAEKKGDERFPNEGRKVLLFSDSRQRAAKLARDMSNSSDLFAARQLFTLAISQMERQNQTKEFSLDEFYGFFCLMTGLKKVQIFHGPDRELLNTDSHAVLRRFRRSQRQNRAFLPGKATEDAPDQMKEYLLRLFSGGFNTLYDNAICWIEPTADRLDDVLDLLEQYGIEISEQELLEFFNAWIQSILDQYIALGHSIDDSIRLRVRPKYEHYGLTPDWSFSPTIRKIMGWKKGDKKEAAWKSALEEIFLGTNPGNGKKYISLKTIKPRFEPDHTWFKCKKCSEVTPYTLKGQCPSCGSDQIYSMEPEEYKAFDYWRKPVQEVIEGKEVHVINTEEHTAQLSHKDQRDELWSKTEQYELRFQDMIQEGQVPVDILSSTTTMEVGIDIGSLVAIGLRNIPPMRENYQQRAGRAGRRGSSLSTIVTFCEDGPHDSLYFSNPVSMLRGDPRKPWIDCHSEKLLQRHLIIVILQEYLELKAKSLDTISTEDFFSDSFEEFKTFLSSYNYKKDKTLLPAKVSFHYKKFVRELETALTKLKEKYEGHTELYEAVSSPNPKAKKVLLDSLYEEGIIPTYSFPKNVVSTYIQDASRKVVYKVDRGLDMAIEEYAPGRAIVVDKQTYQIGGFYYPRSEYNKKVHQFEPARSYLEDPEYVKNIISCDECGWFGLEEENDECCPFCGNKELKISKQMLKPWGFTPRNAESIDEAQLNEEYTHVQLPLYSTLPKKDEMKPVAESQNIRVAARTNQRIIMLNKGINDKGFTVCAKCGAAMPGDDKAVLENLKRPYKNNDFKKCNHSETVNVNLGYDFITDMLVLEFALDNKKINTSRNTKNMQNLWLARAAQSLAEAFRLVASKKLDVEFTELVAGYRLRTTSKSSYIDIYLYDSLSSGAGYAVSLSGIIEELIKETKEFLQACDCESACSKCLKHYRNQYIHGLLDRFAALQLLEYGMEGKMAPDIELQKQEEMLSPLKNILKEKGCLINFDNEITAHKGKEIRQIIVYPAMRKEPKNDAKTIYISDAYLKYAKPYALQKILEGF